jgi:hypothetical protein
MTILFVFDPSETFQKVLIESERESIEQVAADMVVERTL